MTKTQRTINTQEQLIKQDMPGYSEGVISEQTHDVDQKHEISKCEQEKDKIHYVPLINNSPELSVRDSNQIYEPSMFKRMYDPKYTSVQRTFS